MISNGFRILVTLSGVEADLKSFKGFRFLVTLSGVEADFKGFNSFKSFRWFQVSCHAERSRSGYQEFQVVSDGFRFLVTLSGVEADFKSFKSFSVSMFQRVSRVIARRNSLSRFIGNEATRVSVFQCFNVSEGFKGHCEEVKPVPVYRERSNKCSIVLMLKHRAALT